ncbi:MAG TPA: sodium-dependent transporter [Vicinamibacteria bacterium]|nr:sodium-dependent transporter [Vicinamibacteria bacterium]
MTTGTRETFGSRFGSIMVLIGVAVGLANVWRFPYMAGSYGGAAFVALYILFAVLLGIPAIMAEWTLGRLTRQGTAGAFSSVGMPGGGAIGFVLFFTVFMAESYYTLVVGQVAFYAFETAFVGSAGADPASYFDHTLSGITMTNVSVTALTFLAIGSVLFFGVRKGIEWASRIIMPLVFLALLVVIARSVTLAGASDGIRFFLLPDWSKLNGQTALAALGQVFFSLSLGGTFFLVYGSYLRDDEDIPGMAIATAGGDLAAALLGGLAILPAVFAMGVEPDSGPSLLFITLPGVFAEMPGGALMGGLFFGALFLAAFLSAIAAMEVLVDGLHHYCGFRRGRALAILIIADLLVAMPSMASSDILMWNDLIWGSTMQPVGSALTLVALGWFVQRGRVLEEIRRGASIPIGRFWIFWIRWIVPAAIVIVLVHGWTSG